MYIIKNELIYLVNYLFCSKNISIFKSLCEAEDEECDPCVGSIDDIVEHIDVMCDEKNNRIKDLELNLSQLQHRLENIFVTGVLFSNEDSVERCGEEVKSMDDLVSSIEEHVKLMQLNSESLEKEVAEVNLSLERAHCALNDKENEVQKYIGLRKKHADLVIKHMC